MYEFTKDCMLNIEQLDNEHRRLFQMVNEAVSLIDTVDDVSTISTGLINNLKDYAATHFAHEEAYMESISYKNMFMQKVQHDALRRQMAEWDLDSIDEHQEETIDEILSIVTDWLVDHILTYDKQIGTK